MTRFLVAVITTATAASLPVFLTGALSEQVRAELRFSQTAHGLAFGAFFASAAMGSAALGRFAQRIGPDRALRATALAGGVLQVAIALFASSWLALSLMLCASGLVTALAQPAANLLLARAVPRDRQGLAFGIKQSAIPTAAMLGGIAVPAIALRWGWRWAFVGGGLFALASAATVPRVIAKPGEPERAAVVSIEPPMDALVTLALAIACGAAAAGALTAFVVTTGVRAGLSDANAGWALTLGSALCIASRLWLGARADRPSSNPLRTVRALLWVGAGAYALLGIGHWTTHVVATAVAFGAGWAWPGLFNLAVVRSSPDNAGTATGITQTGTYLGAVFGPACFGLMVDRASFEAAWSMAAVFAVLGGLLALEAQRRLERHAATPRASSVE